MGFEGLKDRWMTLGKQSTIMGSKTSDIVDLTSHGVNAGKGEYNIPEIRPSSNYH